jgi:hypothetical protein
MSNRVHMDSHHSAGHLEEGRQRLSSERVWELLGELRPHAPFSFLSPCFWVPCGFGFPYLVFPYSMVFDALLIYDSLMKLHIKYCSCKIASAVSRDATPSVAMVVKLSNLWHEMHLLRVLCLLHPEDGCSVFPAPFNPSYRAKV